MTACAGKRVIDDADGVEDRELLVVDGAIATGLEHVGDVEPASVAIESEAAA
jgi:hypothetical protein